MSASEQPAGDRPVEDPQRVAPTPPHRERAPDDSDVGWGERPADQDDDDRRYLDDRPPHWGSD